MLTLVMQYYV